MGGIPWDSEGLNRDRGIGPSHPLNPVFDAIELIKNDMDELSEERTKAEEKLRKSEDRYHALFDNNPIETIVVDREAKVTGYNLAKKGSGGRLPNINDVMYKDYAGKHKINMFEELAECIGSGIPKEFPKQGYKDKFLYIRIAPFSEGAIITAIDITGQKQVEKRIKHLNSILKAIRNVNQMIVLENDKSSLLQKACNILIETRGYDAVWLGFSEDGETFAAAQGAGFREDISRFSKHVIGGDHPPCIRRIIAEKQKLLIIDKPGECGDCFFKDACAGKKSVIIRIEYANRFYGFLAILFAPDVAADEEETEFLKEIADDIGIAFRGIEMEETLVESEQRFADVINFLPDATFAIDLEGKVVIWNRAIEDMTGVKAEDIIGKGNYEYALPFYGARRPVLIDLLFKSDRKIEKKYSFVHRDGDTLLAETEVPFTDGRNLFLGSKASPMYDLQGNVAGAIESIRDITNRKRTESELRESETKYRSVFEKTGTATVIVEDDMTISMANSEFEKLSGYSKKEIEGKMRWTDFVVEEDLKKVKEYHIKRRENGKGVPAKYEFRFVGRQGDIKDMFLLVEMIPGTKRSICSLTDITALRKSLEEKEILLKEIHHRVKNNMQVISSLLSLQSQYVNDKKSLEMFKESENRIRSMASVHEKLYQSGDLTRIDFADYTQSIIRQLITSYGIDPGVVRININCSDVFLSIDEAVPCGLIINELLSNALKHAFPKGKGGEIVVDFHPDRDNTLTLVVSDTGIGLPEDTDITDAKTLGLQLIGDLVNQLGGTLDIERDGGTAFRITF